MEIKAYPKIKNGILLCLLFLGIQLVTGLILGLVIGLLGISAESIVFGIGMIVLDILSYFIVILIGLKKSGQKPNDIFRFNKLSLDYWAAIIVFMFGFIIISSELDNLLIYFLPMPAFFQNTFELLIIKQLFIISILLVGILPGLLEEMLFRGILLNGFEKNYSEKKAILISALLFGIVHLNPWQFVTAFIMGIILAWVYIRTKSIILCIYMHIFNNLVSVITLRYKEVLPIKGFNTAYNEHSFHPLWFDAVGIILTITGVLLIMRAVKKAKNIT